MSINEINQLTHPQHLMRQGLRLKKGDIIRGRILHLLPNQTAKIQIGSQLITARLEAPLVNGGRYFFQVEQTNHPFHLKVMHIGDHGVMKKSVHDLLRHLGISPTKEMVRLTSFLLKSNIPIQKQIILFASQLISQSTNKPLTMDILKQMITRQIPIKSSIFKALHTNAIKNINDLVKSIINQPKHVLLPIEEELVTMLKRITERPVTGIESLVEQIKADIKANDKQIFLLLKALGAIKKDISFLKWQTEWTHFFNQQQRALSQMPFSLKEGTFFSKLDLLIQHKGDIQQAFQQMLQSDRITTSMSTHVPKIIQSLWNNLRHHSYKEQDVRSTLQMLANDAVYDRMKIIAQAYKSSNKFLSATLKNRFLTHVIQTIDELGLAYEHQLISSGRMNNLTVKGLLLQILGREIGNKELYQNLLNFINGTQLLSFHETNQMVNISLQLPAEKLGLIGSMKLDISGQKKANGKLDEEFCRILFYLNLTSIHMTVIDMFIQKRTISLTIYNDKTMISQIGASFEESLKVALKKLDYQLSHIAYKPFSDDIKKEKRAEQVNVVPESLKGVDYRI